MKDWLTREVINGTVQILGSGIMAIGAINFCVLIWYGWYPQQFSDFFPAQGSMAMPTALAFLMTGASLVLLTMRPRYKTNYRRDIEAESP